MVDYGQNPEFIYYIETRLDEPVSILGIKFFNFFPIFLSLFATLFIADSLPLAVFMCIFSICWFRKLYADEMKGDPTTHRSNFLRIFYMLPKPIRVGVCPSLVGLSPFNKVYRR